MHKIISWFKFYQKEIALNQCGIMARGNCLLQKIFSGSTIFCFRYYYSKYRSQYSVVSDIYGWSNYIPIDSILIWVWRIISVINREPCEILHVPVIEVRLSGYLSCYNQWP